MSYSACTDGYQRQIRVLSEGILPRIRRGTILSIQDELVVLLLTPEVYRGPLWTNSPADRKRHYPIYFELLVHSYHGHQRYTQVLSELTLPRTETGIILSILTELLVHSDNGHQRLTQVLCERTPLWTRRGTVLYSLNELPGCESHIMQII